MILQALAELAHRDGLVDDPNFEEKPVDFYLSLSNSGELLGLVSLRDESKKGKPLGVPWQPKTTSGIAPGFLVSNATYVLGVAKKGKNDPARDLRCRAAFAQLIAKAFEATEDDGLKAVVRFYEDIDTNLEKVLKARPQNEWTGSELIAFAVDGDDIEYVHKRPLVRAHWAKLRLSEQVGALTRCLVTGAMASPARLHASIKRIPKAKSSGASMVSFEPRAFQSHGLSQGQNAPVSREAADAYVTALNWLLAGTAERPHRYGVRLGDNSVTVFWTKKKEKATDLFASLVTTTDAGAALRAAEAAWRGKRAELDANKFYALTLSGNAARVVVRDWFESTMGAVTQNVLQYFDHLAIGNATEPMPILGLVSALKPPGREISPELASKLFSTALRGTPFPRELLRLALTRLRVPVKENEKGLEGYRLRARVSLIKATLIRLHHGSRKEITVSLDSKNTETPYLLGRLFAVLERLQGAALGDVNASIRDRYFASASTTPSIVFPRLLKVSMHHAAKADSGTWFEKIKTEIMGALPAEKFPRLMSLEEQGLFAVGYYHQREFFFTPRADRTAPAEQN